MLLTAAEVAQQWRCSVRTVHHLLYLHWNGDMKTVRQAIDAARGNT